MRAVRYVAGALVLVCLTAPAALALECRLVDARTGLPVAGAEVSVVGAAGSRRTDVDGRVTVSPDPKPPFVLLIVLADGRVARPVGVDRYDVSAVLTVMVESAVTEEVTVAAGVAPSVEAAPGAALTMLSARAMELSSPANLTQAIAGVPGVSQLSEGQAAVPAVRGLARGRTLLLIDGSRVSSERRVGPSATFLDPAVIEGVDVARGPGSVAYGSDAIGGVISIRTRRPGYSGRAADASISAGMGVPDRRVDLSLAQGFGAGGLLVAGHWRTAGDYDAPDGVVLNSGWGDSGALVRAERSLWGGVVTGSWQGDFSRDIERPRNNSDELRVYSPHERSHRLNVSFVKHGAGPLHLLRASGFAGTLRQRLDQDRAATPARPREIARADQSARDVQVRLTGETLAGRFRVEFGLDVNGRLNLEADDILIQYDAAGSVASTVGTVSIDSARRLDTGVYLQSRATVRSAIDLAAGLRVDRVTSRNVGGYFGSRRAAATSSAGFLAVTASPAGGLTFSAQVARAFRDPTLSDRYYRGPTGRGFITGNPDLEAETTTQIDLGVRYASRRFRAAAYYYRYAIHDLVERYQTAPDFFFFRNRGRARLDGLEFELQADLTRGFLLEVSAHRSAGIAVDDAADLDDVGAPTIALNLRGRLTSDASAFARVAWFADDDRPGPNEVAAPGYTSIDAGLTWELSRRVEARAAVRNLLNEVYYASPDPRFVLAPGRNAFVALRVRL
jgi:hemoglobin/transferrin/lactoferrin receptor protein